MSAHVPARPAPYGRPSVPAAASDGPLTVLYLGGIGRSGSTLLERMVGELPGVCSLGEVVHMWDRALRDDERCGCGLPFSACPFWQAVGERAFGGWGNVSVDRHFELRARVDDVRRTPALLLGTFGRSFRRDVEEYTSYFQRVYEAAQAVSGARLIVDSSKYTPLYFCLRRRKDVDLRLLHLIRDSRAVAYSWTKVVRRPEARGNDEFMYRISPDRMALIWSVHNTLLALPRFAGSPTRTLRYEDFARDPEAALRHVAEFAGLELPEGAMDFLTTDAVQLSTSHQVAGNPMRFTTGEVRIRRDDAWKTELDRSDRRRVAVLTAPVATAFGYSPFRSR
jgi:hypothetical protein